MNNCKHSGSDMFIKIGFKHGVQKWRCKDCGKYQGAVDGIANQVGFELNLLMSSSTDSLSISADFE